MYHFYSIIAQWEKVFGSVCLSVYKTGMMSPYSFDNTIHLSTNIVMCVTSELQMWMSVLEALIPVILMQLATTLKGVTLALATLDTKAMDFLAQVSAAIQQLHSVIPMYHFCSIIAQWEKKFGSVHLYICVENSITWVQSFDMLYTLIFSLLCV